MDLLPLQITFYRISYNQVPELYKVWTIQNRKTKGFLMNKIFPQTLEQTLNNSTKPQSMSNSLSKELQNMLNWDNGNVVSFNANAMQVNSKTQAGSFSLLF